ncbi:hypothetical protein D9K95_10205 [Klebsiella pneumoniae]|nr:hypothetical protein D9K95_10205 [Klebsiella pneumoniae]
MAFCGVDGEHHAKKPDQRAYIQHFFGLKIRAVHHGENYPLDYREQKENNMMATHQYILCRC